MTDELLPLTWKMLATIHPGFVQWIVQRHGGVPEGLIQESDYERFRAEYEAENAQ